MAGKDSPVVRINSAIAAFPKNGLLTHRPKITVIILGQNFAAKIHDRQRLGEKHNGINALAFRSPVRTLMDSYS